MTKTIVPKFAGDVTLKTKLSRDPAWLDKAIRIVDRLVREANGKQRGKGPDESLADPDSNRVVR